MTAATPRCGNKLLRRTAKRVKRMLADAEQQRRDDQVYIRESLHKVVGEHSPRPVGDAVPPTKEE